MQIDIVELGKRIKDARVIDGVLVGQAKFLQRIDPKAELEMSQSILSAIELGRPRCSADRLEQLAQKAGIEIPYLVNGKGSEAQENLATEAPQEKEERRQVVTRHVELAASRPLNREINVLACCAHEIETLADKSARGRVVDYLFQLYVQPYLPKEQKD